MKDAVIFIQKIRFPIFVLAVLWIIKLFEEISGVHLYFLGIYPREWSGLPGIFTSVFIHSSWSHLASNSIPLIVLMSIMVLFYGKAAKQGMISIMLGEGIMVWLFARPSYHIGASGLVYGLIAFVFWTGVFRKNAKSIVLSLIILTLYAGSVEGLFPGAEKNISWESHLFGALVGLVVAFVLKNVVEEDEKQYGESPWIHDDITKRYFFPRDIFEKTRIERYYDSLMNDEQNNEIN